jgi:hypothetical protein
VISIGIFPALALVGHITYVLHFFAQISWPLGPLVSVVDFEPKKSWVHPKQAKKEEQKIQVLPGDKKSESNFSRIQSGINHRNFGPEFSA